MAFTLPWGYVIIIGILVAIGMILLISKACALGIVFIINSGLFVGYKRRKRK